MNVKLTPHHLHLDGPSPSKDLPPQHPIRERVRRDRRVEVIPLRARVEVLGGPVRDADDLHPEIVVFVRGGVRGSGAVDGAQVGGEEDGGGFREEAE